MSMGRTTVSNQAPSRTVAIVGHPNAGKTQLAEVLLHTAGVVRQPGDVDEGTSLLDWRDEARGSGTVGPGVAWLPWRDTVLHVIDTPGDEAQSFTRDLARAGTDADLLVVSGPDGVERGTEDLLTRARHSDRALIVCVAKADRGLDLAAITARAETLCRRRVLPVQLPLWDGRTLVGVVDLIARVALRFDPDHGGTFSPEPVPTGMAAAVDAAREALLEALAMGDDALLEAYLEHLDLPTETAWEALGRAVDDGSIVPVFLTSASAHVGAAPLLDALRLLVPTPAAWVMPSDQDGDPTVVAQWVGTWLDEEAQRVTLLRVWHGAVRDQLVLRHARTGQQVRLQRIYGVRGPRRAKARHAVAGALVATWETLPGGPGDAYVDRGRVALAPPPRRPPMAWLDVVAPEGREDDLHAALEALGPLDPTVGWSPAPAGAVRLAGVSQRQLGLHVRRLSRFLGTPLASELPPVDYRERPAQPVRGAQGIHKRERDGLVAEYGEVWLDLEPTSPEQICRIDGQVDEDVLPARFVGSAGEGARRACAHGPTAGYPVAGVHIRLTGGEYDALESTEDHFETAGEIAVKTALRTAGTELLEPWSEVVVHVPPDQVGDVLSDLGAHRAQVQDVQVGQQEASIVAHCPDREVRTLSARLETLTRGAGWFVARPSHYDRLPAHLVSEAVRSSPYRRALAGADAP